LLSRARAVRVSRRNRPPKRAEVNTGFVTNLGDHEIVAEACPDLHRIIKTANAINLKAQKKQLRNLQYPDAIITAARMNYFAVHVFLPFP